MLVINVYIMLIHYIQKYKVIHIMLKERFHVIPDMCNIISHEEYIKLKYPEPLKTKKDVKKIT